MGNESLESRLENLDLSPILQCIGQILELKLEAQAGQVGFSIQVFTYGEKGVLRYGSTADRKPMEDVLRELIAQWERDRVSPRPSRN